MIALLFLAANLATSPKEEVVFFSDDVTKQSEKEMCEPLCPSDEHGLTEHLNCETLRLYNSLDGKGKLRAIELSKTYKDKNEAVRVAAQEMRCRQNEEYPFQKDYQEQLEERSQLKPYTKRYGY